MILASAVVSSLHQDSGSDRTRTPALDSVGRNAERLSQAKKGTSVCLSLLLILSARKLNAGRNYHHRRRGKRRRRRYRRRHAALLVVLH